MKKIVDTLPKENVISINDLRIDATKIYVLRRLRDNNVGVYSFSKQYFVCLDNSSDGWSIAKDELHSFKIIVKNKDMELYEFDNKKEFGKWLAEI